MAQGAFRRKGVLALGREEVEGGNTWAAPALRVLQIFGVKMEEGKEWIRGI